MRAGRSPPRHSLFATGRVQDADDRVQVLDSTPGGCCTRSSPEPVRERGGLDLVLAGPGSSGARTHGSWAAV